MMKLSALLALVTLVSLVTAHPVESQAKKGPATYRGVKIVSNRSGLCVAANPDRHGVANGTPVVLLPCDRAVLTWDIHRGRGSVVLNKERSGYKTDYALDAGLYPDNFGKLKVWQSYPGLYQQTWYYTDDNRIAITGGNQCLDDGGDGGLQTYRCTTGNTNQIFTIYHPPAGGPARKTPAQKSSEAEPEAKEE